MKFSLYIAFFCCLYFLPRTTFGQDNNTFFSDSLSASNSPLKFKDKLYYGGNLSFNIFNGWILFDASPFVGYKIKPKFSFGLGSKYIYRGNPEIQVSESYYGASVFSRFLFHKNFFVHSEYELLNAYELRPLPFPNGDRTLASMFLFGGAYSKSIGGNATVQILILYDLINDYNSPYKPYYIFGSSGPPILYRVGFSFGF